MQTEAQLDEFLSLLSEAREQITYLKELGVDGGVEKTKSGSVTIAARVTTPQPPLEKFSAVPSASKAAARSPVSSALFDDLTPQPIQIQKSSETFEEIWADIGNCTRCPLYERRTNIVHTDGNRKARLMFVGEAPGADEDIQARPFVGRAGQLLTKIIEAIGLKREEVLIGNVNRCRPPGNRPPTPEEAAMCKPFLLREIAAAQPEVIVVLGNTAMRNLLDLKQGITKVRGNFQDYHGVKVMPTFHPAYLLRDPSKKKETWEDLKKVRDYLDATRKP